MYVSQYISRKEILYIEFTAVYFALPVFFAFVSKSSPVLALVTVCAAFSFYLYKNPEFNNASFFNLDGLRDEFSRIIPIFLLIISILFVFTKYYMPALQFFCIKQNFTLWCIIMLVYPIFSVYPQEVIFRAFLFKRYGELFQSEKTLVHLSAVAFSFAHIIYFNPVAMLLTLGGGYLFAWTYLRTRSILLVSLEHALYGCAIFTIGLGRFFYAGFDKLLQ